jgi:WD40 repeat protein
MVEVKKITALNGHSDCVYTIEQGPQPYLFFSGAGDGMIVSWDLRNPEVGQLVARLPNSSYALHFLEREDLLVAGHNYDGIHLLDWKEKQEVRSLKLTSAAIFDIRSFGDYLFASCGDGSVVVVDRRSWVVTSRINLSTKSARSMAIHAPSRTLAVGYSDHMVRVLDLDTLKVKNEWLAHQNSVLSVVFAPDGSVLLSAGRDARIKAWDVASNYELKAEVPAHLYAINNIAYSPDSKHFVTCSLDKSIKVWDSGSLQLLKVIDKSRHAGHGTSVNKLLWTTFNNQLLSASDDRTISVWELFFDRE